MKAGGRFYKGPTVIEMPQGGMRFQNDIDDPSWMAEMNSKSKPKYKVDTTLKSKGTGVQKSGYQLPPIKLPGMTPEKKKKVEEVVRFMSATQQLNKVAPPKTEEEIFRRNQNAFKGIASIVGPTILEEVANLVPGRRRDASNALQQFSSIASFIPGIGQYAYLMGAIGGPLMDLIIAAAEAAAKNNAVPGVMNAPADLEEYAKFLNENKDANITIEEWREYKKQLEEYEKRQSGAMCRKITPEMLGDMTLEEFAAQAGLDIEDMEDEAPPTYKKFTAEETRDITEEERKLLEGPMFRVI